ncbi:MAG: hypothetical protein ACLPZY_18845 [Terracidiphilus sp.]
MRDGTKVIIGLGSIWGLFAFGAMVISSFTIGENDTAPEVVALVLYGFTLLPSCILAIWRRRASAIWLIALAFLTAYGLAYQEVHQAARGELSGSLSGDVIRTVIVAAIPGIIGILLLRSERRDSFQPQLKMDDRKWER